MFHRSKEFEREEHRLLPWWSMVRRSVRWGRLSGKKVKKMGFYIWCCGKDIPSLTLVGSLNRISEMLFWSWGITCATSGLRINVHTRSEETRRKIDGGSEDFESTGVFAAEGPGLVGTYMQGKIRFGPPDLHEWFHRLCTWAATTTLVYASVCAGSTFPWFWDFIVWDSFAIFCASEDSRSFGGGGGGCCALCLSVVN